MLSSVYLAGGSADTQNILDHVQGPDWRSLAMTRLQHHGLKIVNPLEIVWSGLDGFDNAEDAIAMFDSADSRVRRALDLIDQSDAILANLMKSSYATAMEIFYAYRRGKVVTVIGNSPFNPWVLSHSQARFGDVDKAIEYIVGEYPRALPVNWALQYEALLSERYEQMPPAGEPDYKFIGGELPVLVVAPHATAFWQEGEFLEAEAFTGSMAALLNRTAGCHSLLSHYCCVADPCWYLETPFRRAYSDVIKAGQIGMVLMLVGSSWHEAPGLQLSCYGPSETVALDYATRLRSKLSAIEPVAEDSYDHYVRPLARFTASELNCPIVVLRLHKRYRMPRLQPQLFSRAASLISEFILETGSELAKANA